MKNKSVHINDKPIRAIIVDDEVHARENLQGLLKEYCPDVNLVGMAEDVPTARELIDKESPNLILLDIKLSNHSGFELLDIILERDFEVIFVTAYDQFALKAIKLSAVDYILKPINPEELREAVKKLSRKMDRENKATRLELLAENLSRERAFNRLLVESDGAGELLKLSSILRLQGESNYTRIFLEGDRKLLVSKTLAEFEYLLSDLGFFRVHKTHLVNLVHIYSFHRTGEAYLVLDDHSKIPVSRRRKVSLHNALKDTTTH